MNLFFFWQSSQYFEVVETTYPLKRVPKFDLKPSNKLMRLSINLLFDTLVS